MHVAYKEISIAAFCPREAALGALVAGGYPTLNSSRSSDATPRTAAGVAVDKPWPAKRPVMAACMAEGSEVVAATDCAAKEAKWLCCKV